MMRFKHTETGRILDVDKDDDIRRLQADKNWKQYMIF